MNNQYFEEILSVLEKYQVELLLVGGYALAIHGRVRMTEDLDLWVRDNDENLARLQTALEEYLGATFTDEQANQLRTPGFMISFGRPPSMIEIHKEQIGITFDDAWSERTRAQFCDRKVNVVSVQALLSMKRACIGKRSPNSAKFFSDQADLAWLEKIFGQSD